MDDYTLLTLSALLYILYGPSFPFDFPSLAGMFHEG